LPRETGKHQLPRSCGIKGRRNRTTFDAAHSQHGGVQQNHPAGIAVRRLAAPRAIIPAVASGDAQLHEPQQNYGEEQREKRRSHSGPLQ